jgi:outer membrane protein assembly factor BamB
MSNPEGVRAITCPSCGAQLHVAEGVYRTTCDYCGALLELPRPTQPDGTTIVVVNQGKPAAGTATPRTISGAGGIIVTATILLVIVGLVSYFIVQGLGGDQLSTIVSSLSSYHISTPSMILPRPDGRAADAIVFTYDGSKDTRFLSYFDGVAQALRWQTDPLGDDSYRTVLAQDGQFVFAAVKTQLMALDRGSGSIVWQASLSDEVPSNCQGECLVVAASRVVALTRDGRLTAFDEHSGGVVWNIRLNSTPDHFFLVKNEIAVFDNRDEKVALVVVDAMDGSEQRILRPECQDSSSGFTDEPDLNSPVLLAPDQESVVILFGFFSTCAQRWSVTSGSLLWNASLGDSSFSPAFDPAPVLSGDSIFLAAGNQVIRIRFSDGEWGALIEDPDYEFVPLAARDGVLITRAKRTRGTTRFELWGVSLSDGKQVWQHPFPDSEPLDGPDSMSGLIDKGDSAWTAQLTSAGLVIVTASADPHQLTVETLDPSTGTSGAGGVIPLTSISGDFYSVPDVMGWYHDQLWLIIEGKVYVLDPAQANAQVVWP